VIRGCGATFAVVGIESKAPAISLTEFHGDQWAPAWVGGVMGVRFLGIQAFDNLDLPNICLGALWAIASWAD
jgi:hypothetical protein